MADPVRETRTEIWAGLTDMKVDAFVFQRLPQTLDEDVFRPPATIIPADAVLAFFQHLDKAEHCELRTPIGNGSKLCSSCVLT